MMEEIIYTISSIVAGILVSQFLLLWILDQNRDIPALYLNQQLYHDLTRLDGESPVYRSIKCDSPHCGPRVGLDIRYEQYKLRNGNLSDVWLLAMSHASRDSKFGICFGTRQYSIAQLHGLVEKYARVMSGKTGVYIPSFLWLNTPAVFAATVAAFITQTPVTIYDSENVKDINNNSVYVYLAEQKPPELVCAIWAHEDVGINVSEFDYEYHPAKDTGIALILERKVCKRVDTTTSFTQFNLVSAVASTLKHLPEGHSLGVQDVVLFELGYGSVDECVGSLVKVLAALISGCNVHLMDVVSRETLLQLNPTILVVSTCSIVTIVPKINGLWNRIRSNIMTRGRFGVVTNLSMRLRLLYLHQSILQKQDFDSRSLNMIRCSLGCRLVLERTHYNIAGAVLLNDIFDYRIHNVDCRGFGAIFQSLEMKLCNLDLAGKGQIHVRGYCIGKSSTHSQTKGVLHSKGDGFMPLNLYGQWGNDGCLYIF